MGYLSGVIRIHHYWKDKESHIRPLHYSVLCKLSAVSYKLVFILTQANCQAYVAKPCVAGLWLLRLSHVAHHSLWRDSITCFSQLLAVSKNYQCPLKNFETLLNRH